MARRSDHSRDELNRMALDSARKLISKHGLRGLSTRQVAALMGYSAGTLYQLFEDLDELIMRVNAETLDGLIAACRDVDYSKGPEPALEELGRRYIAYVTENPLLWSAVLEHILPAGREAPPWLLDRSATLLGFAERAVEPLFAPGEAAERRHVVRVLWAGLYGIAALATAHKLPDDQDPRAMVATLVGHTIAGLKLRHALG